MMFDPKQIVNILKNIITHKTNMEFFVKASIYVFLLISVGVFHEFVKKSRNKKSILVLGDSHTRVFCYINKKQLMPNVDFKVVTVNGATAQGACNPNSKTNALAKFRKSLVSERKHDNVIIMLGEVDCGFVIWYRKEKYDTSIDEQLDNSVTKLFQFIDNDVITKYRAEQITVIGANLPTLFDHRNVSNKVANLRKDVKTSIRDRTDLTLRYNDILKKECTKRGYKYIDIVKDTIDPITKLVDKRYLHENKNNHHLSEAKTALLWKKALFGDRKINIKPRILVSYVYYEKNNTKMNLDFFLKHGLKDNIHVIINIKNEHTNIKGIQNEKNITKLRTTNEGFDFAGHLQNIKHMRSLTNIESTFDYVVLMNDSCIGPFYLYNEWYDPFIEKLKYSEYVGITRNNGWFNMCKVDLLHQIENIIDRCPRKSYMDAVKIERTLYKSFKNDNILKIKNHSDSHSCFQAIFVKENRIGNNNGFSAKKTRLSYITPFDLQLCILLQDMKSILF